MIINEKKIFIRRNEAKDDAQIEKLIRTCLLEFGEPREGTAWFDPMLGKFSQIYDKENTAYWVAVGENDTVLAGVGIGPIPGAPGICELQKMYSYKEVRGTGLAQVMLDIALDFAKGHYEQCYLESFANMFRAHAFYEKNGFKYIDHFVSDTGHHGCEVKMIKPL